LSATIRIVSLSGFTGRTAWGDRQPADAIDLSLATDSSEHPACRGRIVCGEKSRDRFDREKCRRQLSLLHRVVVRVIVARFWLDLDRRSNRIPVSSAEPEPARLGLAKSQIDPRRCSQATEFMPMTPRRTTPGVGVPLSGPM